MRWLRTRAEEQQLRAGVAVFPIEEHGEETLGDSSVVAVAPMLTQPSVALAVALVNGLLQGGCLGHQSRRQLAANDQPHLAILLALPRQRSLDLLDELVAHDVAVDVVAAVTEQTVAAAIDDEESDRAHPHKVVEPANRARTDCSARTANQLDAEAAPQSGESA